MFVIGSTSVNAILQTDLEVVLQYIIAQASPHTHIQLTNSLIKVYLYTITSLNDQIFLNTLTLFDLIQCQNLAKHVQLLPVCCHLNFKSLY